MDEISISLRLLLDKDGFLRRECPHCRRQFKQWQGTRDDTHESPEAYYRPYCYASADADTWYTAQQIEYIQQQAMAEVVGPHLYRLQEQIEQASHNGLFRIEMDAPLMVEPEPLVECNDMVQLAFPCHVEEPIKVDEQWNRATRYTRSITGNSKILFIRQTTVTCRCVHEIPDTHRMRRPSRYLRESRSR